MLCNLKCGRWLRGALLLNAVALFWGGPVSTHAAEITIDFESPAYDLGKIVNGEDGWKVTATKWAQNVTNLNPISGSQSWIINSTVTSGSFGDQPYTPALSGGAGESGSGAVSNYFAASMSFKPLVNGAVGEGTTISIDDGTGARGNWIRIEKFASATADLWRVLVSDYNGTVFTETLLGTVLAGQVHTLAFDMTFNDGLNNDVWKVYLNGSLAYTGIGWEDYFMDDAAQKALNNPPIAYDRLLFRQGAYAAQAGSVGIMFDDISYTNVAPLATVPEPASMAVWSMLALSGAAIGWRKRKALAGNAKS